MIIYGSKAVNLKSFPARTLFCPNCETQGSLVYYFYRRHAHVFWIPIFPLAKKCFSQCQNCQNVIESNHMNDSMNREYLRLKPEAKGPIWQFVGLALIAVLVGKLLFDSSVNEKKELEYLASPLSGDIYEYKYGASRYSTLMVTGVEDDSLTICPNDYEINKISGIDDIDIPENYGEFQYKISRQDILEMHSSGEIIGVNRDSD